MRFAIVSDIHGNLPALNAVIEDAAQNNIDSFLLAGDYCLSNPYPNECISRIRTLDNAYIICGNEELYLERLIGKDPRTWTDGQMQISYYGYQKISPENMDYILSMPKQMKLECGDITLHMAHSSEVFISDCEHREWSTAKVAARYKDRWITRETFCADIHKYFNEDERFHGILSKLERGVYIFGHSHIQWNYRSDDGSKILINPGSCGLPLDCIDAGIPYTILDISDSEIVVEEKRAAFNMDEYIEMLRHSDQFIKANVWSKIIIRELRTRREYMFSFLAFVEKYAVETGDSRRPFSVSTWEKAYELWNNVFEE
ncbi:MAG: metallophosphatase family protein [Lachnospiraceae bacterium]|nr:metallophosphatase family protein [Lachnospiraceae bacterium]